MIEPTSFLDCLDPPDGLVGWAAVFIAMTADRSLLSEAMTRFSCSGPQGRETLGLVNSYLMLDPHASATRVGVISAGAIPGMLEMHPRSVPKKSLLHAKIAMLGYSKRHTDSAPSHLRLVVYTGNFTLASVRYQLELACHWDSPLATMSSVDATDFAAAGAFIRGLMAKRYFRPDPPGGALTKRLDGLLAAIPTGGSGKPRFIHSLTHNLLPQIGSRFLVDARPKTNFLLAGSGFFESPKPDARKPEILDKLEHIVALTAKPTKILVLEPRQAGAVAAWCQKRGRDGWTIVPPTDPAGGRRILHAKYVLIGYLRDEAVHGGCLYLGSGNLSIRGLISSGSADAGNIECGVVLTKCKRLDAIALSKLFWSPGSPAVSDDELVAAEGEPDLSSSKMLVATPILSASQEASPEGRLRLLWREEVSCDAHVSVFVDEAWMTVAPFTVSVARKATTALPILRVRDDDSNNEWRVPVVDAAGRACWAPPRYSSMWDALDALLAFPRLAVGDDDDCNDDDDGGYRSAGGTTTHAMETPRHALYEAAEFIERVAARQAALEAGQVGSWLDHLDRLLAGAPPKDLVDRWRATGIDVLRELAAVELAPRLMSPDQRAVYERTLVRHARTWGGA